MSRSFVTIIESCDGDVNEFVLSRLTLYRFQTTGLLKISASILNKFGKIRPEHVALHWDGNLTKDRLDKSFRAMAVIFSLAPCYKNGKSLEFKKC